MDLPNGSPSPACLKFGPATRVRRRFRIALVVGPLLVAGATNQGAAGTGLTPASVSRSNHVLRSTISHGPMVGAVSDTSVKIWIRAEATPPASPTLTVLYGQVGDPIGVVSDPVILDAGTDFTGTVELTELAPLTSYWFRIFLESVLQPGSDGSFTTLPADGTASSFRFAFGSCNDHLQMPYPIFSTITQSNPAFLLHIGDIIYADRPPAATTRADFEDRYKLNFGESSWQAAMRHLPTFMIWDDHEIENDWSGGQTGLYLEARPAFDEYVSSHNPPPRHPGELWFDFRAGETAFFVLDTRSQRDPGQSTMLGATQLTDLKNWLTTTPSRFKFIVSSVQWTFIAENDDTWYGYQSERSHIFDFIRDNLISGVVLLSGDRHWSGAFRHPNAEPIQLYELSSSPIGAALDTPPPADPTTLFLTAVDRNFINIDVDTTVTPATLTASVLAGDGTTLWTNTISEFDINGPLIFTDGFESGGLSAWSGAVP